MFGWQLCLDHGEGSCVSPGRSRAWWWFGGNPAVPHRLVGCVTVWLVLHTVWPGAERGPVVETQPTRLMVVEVRRVGWVGAPSYQEGLPGAWCLVCGGSGRREGCTVSMGSRTTASAPGWIREPCPCSPRLPTEHLEPSRCSVATWNRPRLPPGTVPGCHLEPSPVATGTVPGGNWNRPRWQLGPGKIAPRQPRTKRIETSTAPAVSRRCDQLSLSNSSATAFLGILPSPVNGRDSTRRNRFGVL